MNTKHIIFAMCIVSMLLVDVVFTAPSGTRIQGSNSEFNLEDPSGQFWQKLVGAASGGRARRQIPHAQVALCGRHPSLCGRPSRNQSYRRRHRGRQNRNKSYKS